MSPAGNVLEIDTANPGHGKGGCGGPPGADHSPSTAHVHLAGVQLHVSLLFKDAGDHGPQDFMQIRHAHQLGMRCQVGQASPLTCPDPTPDSALLTFMNCSIDLEASELERKRVLGSAGRREESVPGDWEPPHPQPWGGHDSSEVPSRSMGYTLTAQRG